MYRIALGLVFYLAVFADAAFQNCGSTVGNWTSVTVSNCDADGPLCIVNRCKHLSIKIVFNLDRDVNKVKARIYGIVWGIKLEDWRLSEDTCEASGLTCPLTKNGSPYEYQRTIYIDRHDFAKVKMDIMWQLTDENDDIIACVLIPIKVKEYNP